MRDPRNKIIAYPRQRWEWAYEIFVVVVVLALFVEIYWNAFWE